MMCDGTLGVQPVWYLRHNVDAKPLCRLLTLKMLYGMVFRVQQ